jgi:hypothetical protein
MTSIQNTNALKWLKLFPLLVLTNAFLLFITEKNELAPSISFLFCLALPNFMVLAPVRHLLFYTSILISLICAIISSCLLGPEINNYAFQLLHIFVLLFSLASLCNIWKSGQVSENFIGLTTSVLLFIYAILTLAGLYSKNFSNAEIEYLLIIGLNFLILNSALIVARYIATTKSQLLLYGLFLLNASSLACFQIYYFFEKKLLVTYFAFSAYILAILAVVICYLSHDYFRQNQKALSINRQFAYWIVNISLCSISLNIFFNIERPNDLWIFLGTDWIFIIFALTIIVFESRSIKLLFVEFFLVCSHLFLNSAYRMIFYLYYQTTQMEINDWQFKCAAFSLGSVTLIKLILLITSVCNRLYTNSRSETMQHNS